MSRLMTAITIVLLPTSITLAQRAFENVAKGRAYTMQPPPGYGLCTDAEDVTQLTDGIFTENYFWTQATTVGWQGTPVVLLTVDLGQTQPIAGLSYSTAAGVAGVAWPREIRIAVSEDGRLWRSPGDLVILSKANDSPPAEGYGTFRYETHELASRGRYVRLAVVTDGAYAFCDELEIFRGSDTLLTSEPQDVVTVDPEVATPMGWSETRTGIFRRLSLDMGTALAAVEQSLLSDASRLGLQNLRSSRTPAGLSLRRPGCSRPSRWPILSARSCLFSTAEGPRQSDTTTNSVMWDTGCGSINAPDLRGSSTPAVITDCRHGMRFDTVPTASVSGPSGIPVVVLRRGTNMPVPAPRSLRRSALA